MAPPEIQEPLRARLSALVAEKTGLHFPPDRWPDLRRGVMAAARELRVGDAERWVERLVGSAPDNAQLETLANHLTIGETYFFREKPSFDALAQRVLPELIRSRRRSSERRLSLWSAACCTGEEPYSLAMLVCELLPDIADWDITILATDINRGFLRKAAAGVYGKWSFRSAPAWIQERYCTPASDDRHSVRREVKRMVTFTTFNLVDGTYPLLAYASHPMDVILCRNVLMYFAPNTVRNVVGNLHGALAEGGWLIVSPTEASRTLFPQFEAVNVPGAILYRKGEYKHPASPSEAPAWSEAHERPVADLGPAAPWPEVQPVSEVAQPDAGDAQATTDRSEPEPEVSAAALYAEGRYAEVAEELLAGLGDRVPNAREFSLLVRALANQGRRDQARAWCERWISIDKLDPSGHYLRAVVLLEDGSMDEASRSLQRALYLQPDFVVAHVASGNLARARGQQDLAARHYANALRLLERVDRDEIVPESNGLAAGRFAEMITLLRQTISVA